MNSEELCLAWLEWFKGWVETNDICHSSLVLATTTKTFDYRFWESGDTIHFTSSIVFTWKDDPEHTLRVPYLIMQHEGKNDFFYENVLKRITSIIVYGKEWLSLTNILHGTANLNWRSNGTVEKETLKDILEKQYGPKKDKNEQ